MMLTWMPGDESPQTEWDAIVNAYYILDGSPERVDAVALFEALKNVLKTANETGRGWDTALEIAESIAGKKSGKLDGIS